MSRVQPAHLLLAMWCAVLMSAPASAGYRFHALLDDDGDITTGCSMSTAAGMVLGGETRVTAHTDRSRVIKVTVERCREGTWAQVESRAPTRSLALNAGRNGGDLIRWTLPPEYLHDQTVVDASVVAEHDESTAADVLTGSGMRLAWGSQGLAEPNPIPFATPAGLILLALAVALLAGRRLQRRVSPGLAAVLLAGVWLNLAFHPELSARAQPDAARNNPAKFAVLRTDPSESTTADSATAKSADPKSADPKAIVEIADAAHDQYGAEAGVDLLYAQLSADASGVQIQVEVRDIEFEPLAEGARVLLLGNSLTSSNRLPEILQAVARQAGRTLVTASVTQGGVNLDDLYRDGDALREIERGRYQVVIMQQGPSSLPASQEDLLLGATQFNAPIRASGARPALYMVWPDITRRGFFDDVRMSYSNAALAIDGMFIPAGEAWRAAWRVDPALPLYAGDQFHPSELGSYAAALSMFSELYGQSPVGLPATLTLASGRTLRFDPDDARLVQQAAWDAHLQYGRAGR